MSSPGAMSDEQIRALLRKERLQSSTSTGSLTPYLTQPGGLSKDEYEDWLQRLCSQGDD